MYQSDVPVIAAAMRRCPDTFARGVMFAVVSARVPFHRVPELMRDLKARGERSRALWGWKAQAYAFLRDHGDTIWRETCATDDPETALQSVMRVPGLGFIKGGFVLQMLGFDVACMDTRNLRRAGISRKDDRYQPRKGRPSNARKARAYLAEVSGRANELWDVWCADVAQDWGASPELVSAVHVKCIVPKGLRRIEPMQVPIAPQAIPF